MHLLWKFQEEEIFYKFCPVDIPHDIIEEVYRLTHHEESSSNVFQKVFAKCKTEYTLKNQHTALTLQDVVNDLWKPVSKEFTDDLQRLRTGLELPLSKVTYLFEDISDLKALTSELEKWCDAVKEPDNRWIRDAAQKIQDYQELCRYSYTARTLMLLKGTLGLTGDFSAIEALVPKEVNDEM